MLTAAVVPAAAAPPLSPEEEEASLRSKLLPIWLGVFVQMLGVGVTLSQLPLYLKGMGASATQMGITISLFSASQMVGAPLVLAASSRFGRLNLIRACLLGAACASWITALAGSWPLVTAARMLAGFFAASVPLAQAAVTDYTRPGAETSLALSRVASAASLGIVVGPAAASSVSALAALLGVPAVLHGRVVFGASGVFTALVLALTGAVTLSPPAEVAGAAGAAEAAGGGGDDEGAAAAAAAAEGGVAAAAPWWAQPLCRWMALVCSWCFTLTVATYAYFATAFLGYAQQHINWTQSAGALAGVATQLLLLPRAVGAMGEHRALACGLLLLGGCFGGASLVRLQPWHALLFVAARVGLALAETNNVALTARVSLPAQRARNLGLLQSTQAGGRIVTPLLAGWLYEASLRSRAAPGAWPFLAAGGLALLSSALPLLLLRAEERQKPKEE